MGWINYIVLGKQKLAFEISRGVSETCTNLDELKRIASLVSVRNNSEDDSLNLLEVKKGVIKISKQFMKDYILGTEALQCFDNGLYGLLAVLLEMYDSDVTIMNEFEFEKIKKGYKVVNKE